MTAEAYQQTAVQICGFPVFPGTNVKSDGDGGPEGGTDIHPETPLWEDSKSKPFGSPEPYDTFEYD
jgi:hypothetical protein